MSQPVIALDRYLFAEPRAAQVLLPADRSDVGSSASSASNLALLSQYSSFLEPPGAPRGTLTQPQSAEAAKKGSNNNENWAGYAIQSNGASPYFFTDVQASWTVPYVSGSGNQNTYSSTWIGLDGYSSQGNTSKTIEQIETEQDVIKGVPTYYA